MKLIKKYFSDLEQVGINFSSLILGEGNKKLDLKKQKLFESVEIQSRSLIIDDAYHRISYIAKLPEVLDPEHFFRLLNQASCYCFSIHILKMDRTVIIKSIKLRRSVLESENNMKLGKGKRSDEFVNREIVHLNRMLEHVINRNEDVFKVSFYFCLNSSSQDILINSDRTFKEYLAGLDYEINTCSFQQLEGFNCILPIANDKLRSNHALLTSNLLSLLPFHYAEHIDASGIFLGFNKLGGGIFIKDLLRGSNMNITIFGSSGSGKSVTAKILILRFMLQKIRMVIIDPEGEYTKLCRELGARLFTISEQEGMDPVILVNSLNCSINQKVEILSHFLLSLTDLALKDSLLISKGIKAYLKNNEDLSFKTLVDVLQKFKSMQFLNSLVTGSMAPLLRGNRTIDINDGILCFDLSGIYSETIKTSLVMLIADVVNSFLKGNNNRTLIFIDEAHKLLINEQSRNFYIDLVKTARKRRAGVVSITQNPEDMNEENGSRIIISQAEHIFLLKHSTASLNYIKRYQLFDLNDSDYNNLNQLNRGSALLLSSKERFYLDIFPLERERASIFT